jgi:hypothetical protein
VAGNFRLGSTVTVGVMLRDGPQPSVLPLRLFLIWQGKGCRVARGNFTQGRDQNPA